MSVKLHGCISPVADHGLLGGPGGTDGDLEGILVSLGAAAGEEAVAMLFTLNGRLIWAKPGSPNSSTTEVKQAS
jgi:hypothetical protein